MRPRSTRAPLWALCGLSLSLAALIPGCFDWDGYVERCRQAGNCRADSGGGGDGGGDGGDGGGSDAGPDGGGGAGDGGLGDSCNARQDCATDACVSQRCVCVFGGACRRDGDCCLGQVCMSGTCGQEFLSPCGGLGSSCISPSGCCSTCNGGSMMCECSPAASRCGSSTDCCSATTPLDCSPGQHCCAPAGSSCADGDQCCSRVCGAAGCL